MEALAFIQRCAPALKVCTPGTGGLWKSLDPSEDGGALPGNVHGSLTVESGDATRAARWFAVYTTCRHEKRVAQHLTQRAIEHYLPLYVSHRKWRDGSRVALELPLFPCYLFIRIHRMQRAPVLSVPGLLTIVSGTGGEPAVLPDAAVEALRLGLEQQKVEPHPLLTAGREVRIRSGAFSGMTGIVARRKGSFRVVLTLQQIMQSIAVEVDERDVEPAGPAQNDVVDQELNLRFV